MDDLLEIILDIGGEVLELLLERIVDKHSSGADAGGTAGEKDPWERIQPVPSWEQTVTRLPWER